MKIVPENLAVEQVRPELTWRMRRDILYPGEPLESMQVDTDADGLHFAAFYNNQLVSVISLVEKGIDYQFRKFSVLAAMQGKGIGSIVLEYITTFARLQGGTRLWCNARVTATGFYLKSGFTPTGERFSKGGLTYEVMEKDLRQLASAPQNVLNGNI